ncbi:hypothetical protein, partial [Methanoculleus sp. MH98A]|uniref:hypothetical protein n=1 Tax=Methanoculleus sp. MH98A TaxID=1495314 RepID=UPI001E367D16
FPPKKGSWNTSSPSKPMPELLALTPNNFIKVFGKRVYARLSKGKNDFSKKRINIPQIINSDLLGNYY